ncbi:MAG: nicotinate-nucleotide--dimethylbenzimidazole phosphoribosyltransferase [Pseudomonadota bacterium]
MTYAPLPAPDADFLAALQARIDGKTKPLGALGGIEALAARLAVASGDPAPRMDRCTLLIFAADHGIAARGVSAFPQAVTAQMVLNFLAGGAAANVFARTLGADIRVVDAGVAERLEHPDLIDRRMGAGTADSAAGPAMPRRTAEAAVEAGRALASEVAAEADALAFGEMGIANTSAAALVLAKLTGQAPGALAGPGTGLDRAGVTRKAEVLEAAAARTAPRLSGMEALAEVGGFEIAMMAGAMIGAAEARRPVLVDGFIATSAAMAARALAPGVERAFVFAHRSAEPGHAAALEALGAEPLLDLGLRLGEGTGALLAWPLARAAAAMLRDMASFADAGVSGPA